MTLEEAAEMIKTEVQARCASCGHNWKLQRGDCFSCPFCPNAPEEVTMAGSLLVLEEDGSPIFGRPRRR